MRRRVNRDTKHILYSNMPGEFKSVLEDGPIEGEPLVSVCVITYNHGKYIKQCLDGILMQKVNFPYEILIHDDASPDDTADIIREYWAKYPTVIKPILREENQYSKGVDVSRFNFDRAKAKYIAQCEGDDYWTDDRKLQMQVDFLEEHGEYSATSHSFQIVNKNSEDIKQATELGKVSGAFTLDDIKYYRLPGQTATLAYRNIYAQMDNEVKDEYYACAGEGDQKLAVVLTMLGDIKMFPEVMSAYRYVSVGGTSYASRMKNANLYARNYKHLIEISKFAKFRYNKDINTEIVALCVVLMAIKRAISSPSPENRKVLSQINSIARENKDYCMSMFKKIIKSPISTITIMKTIYGERKTFKVSFDLTW